MFHMNINAEREEGDDDDPPSGTQLTVRAGAERGRGRRGVSEEEEELEREHSPRSGMRQGQGQGYGSRSREVRQRLTQSTSRSPRSSSRAAGGSRDRSPDGVGVGDGDSRRRSGSLTRLMVLRRSGSGRRRGGSPDPSPGVAAGFGAGRGGLELETELGQRVQRALEGQRGGSGSDSERERERGLGGLEVGGLEVGNGSSDGEELGLRRSLSISRSSLDSHRASPSSRPSVPPLPPAGFNPPRAAHPSELGTPNSSSPFTSPEESTMGLRRASPPVARVYDSFGTGAGGRAVPASPGAGSQNPFAMRHASQRSTGSTSSVSSVSVTSPISTGPPPHYPTPIVSDRPAPAWTYPFGAARSSGQAQTGAGSSHGAVRGAGVRAESVASSPRSSVSSSHGDFIRSLTRRASSGRAGSSSGGSASSSVTGAGEAVNPFFASAAVAGPDTSPSSGINTANFIQRPSIGRDAEASRHLDESRSNLNVRRATEQAAASDSDAVARREGQNQSVSGESTPRSPGFSAMSNPPPPAETPPSPPMKRSFSDQGRYSSPPRVARPAFRTSASSSGSFGYAQVPNFNAMPGQAQGPSAAAMISPGTLLDLSTAGQGLDSTQVTSPLSYADQQRADMFAAIAGSSAGSGETSSLEGGNTPARSRISMGRWATARDVRQSPVMLQRASTSPEPPRQSSETSSPLSDEAEGMISPNAWDSVWPDNSRLVRATDPLTALPINQAGATPPQWASPSLLPHVNPLMVHSRSMSSSSMTSPNMANLGDAFPSNNGSRRGSLIGSLTLRPGSISQRSATSSGGEEALENSREGSINALDTSARLFGLSGYRRSPSSINSIQAVQQGTRSPVLSSESRHPFGQVARSRVTAGQEASANIPDMILTQSTPVGSTSPVRSPGESSEARRPPSSGRSDASSNPSPPFNLPPSVTGMAGSPKRISPISQIDNPLATLRTGANPTSPILATMGEKRPLPPPFRRAISHVASPGSSGLPSPGLRPRAYSGSPNTLARPVLTPSGSSSSVPRVKAPTSPISAGRPSPLPATRKSPEVEPALAPNPTSPVGSDRGSPELTGSAGSSNSPPRTGSGGSPVSSRNGEANSKSGSTSGSSKSQNSSSSRSGERLSSSPDADDESSPPKKVIRKALEQEGGATSAEETPSPVAQAELNAPSADASELVNADVNEAMTMPTDILPADVAFEDEGLLTLERIFLLSKSDHAFHRAYIARMLGDLLEDVDPCEAVEYVIPLLSGFAMDEDESVKEAFASQLHRILWYFFTSCELIGEEDEIPASEDPTSDPVYIVTSEGVRAVRRSNTATGEIRESPIPSSGSAGSGTTSSGSSAPISASTSQDSRKESLVSSTTATSSTPTSSTDTPSSVLTSDTTQSTHAAGPPPGYVFTEPFQPNKTGNSDEMRRAPLIDRPVIGVHVFTPLIGSMLLSQNSLVADPTRAAVVAVLAKLRKAKTSILDEWTGERPEGIRQLYITQSGSHAHDLQPFSTSARRMVQKEFLEGLVLGMGRLEPEAIEASIPRPASDDGSVEKVATLHRTVSRSSTFSAAAQSKGSASSEEAAMLRAQLAQEATLGRAISMNLIASVSEFFSAFDINRFGFVSQLAKTAEDEPGVKAEAALALAGLVKLAPDSDVEVLLALFETFVEEEHEAVRQSACLSLPALSKRIINPEDRRSYTIRAYEALLYSSDVVQYTCLEILGEVIYVFHDDPDGPPQELLDVYFAQSILLETSTEEEEFREFDNLDRAIVSAFNLPAICLAIGRDRWFEARATYKALCNINHPRIITSLAASLHELAKIVGPEIAAFDLLPAYSEYIHGNDESRERVFANLPSFIGALPLAEATEKIEELNAMWTSSGIENWRHREVLASHIGELVAFMASEGHAKPALDLLGHGLTDPFQAVRDAAISCIPSSHAAVKGDAPSAAIVMDLLRDLAISGNFKRRKAYIACVSAWVSEGLDASFFEASFLDDLAILSDDLLDVRITLSKLLGRLCARDGIYPHSPLRPLRLNEMIERLSNDESHYVRGPLTALAPRPRIRPAGPSGVWSSVTNVMSPGSTGSHPSRGTPTDRRSSSASLLIRADSDTTIMPTTWTRITPPEEIFGTGSRSAPSEMVFIPWDSPNSDPPRREVSVTEAHQILGVEREPVQVGMKDVFSTSFGKAVAKARSEGDALEERD